MNSYERLNFVNGQPPKLSADNLNHMDVGIANAFEDIEATTATANQALEMANNTASGLVTATQTANSAYSKSTANAQALADKADKATTLAGYDITDGLSNTEGAVGSSNIADLAVQKKHLSSECVGYDELEEGCVNEDIIADGAVTEDKISDSAKKKKADARLTFTNILATLDTGGYWSSFTHNTNVQYKCTPTPITVSEGDVFRVTGATQSASMGIVTCFDKEQRFVGRFLCLKDSETVSSYVNKCFIVPTGVSYIGFASYFSRTELEVEKGTISVISDNDAIGMIGKTLYSDGDSIAQGASSGGLTYAHLLRDKYNMDLTSCAVTSTTLAVREDRTDSIYERVTAMVGDYDYIILDGGINDVVKGVEVGEVTAGFTDELNIYTTIGALEGICKFLNTHYLTSKKLFVFVHSYLPNYTAQKSLFKKMKEVFNKWAIPYVDLSEISGLANWDSTVATDYLNGIHPTLAGYKKFYFPLIEKKLLFNM